MTIYRLRVLGLEIASFEVDGQPLDITEALREAIEQIADEEVSVEADIHEPAEIITIGGGSGGYAERDTDPRYPETDKDCDSWMPRPFGFAPGISMSPRNDRKAAEP